MQECCDWLAEEPRPYFIFGGTAKIWGYDAKWDEIVGKHLTYIQSRGIPCSTGERYWKDALQGKAGHLRASAANVFSDLLDDVTTAYFCAIPLVWPEPSVAVWDNLKQLIDTRGKPEEVTVEAVPPPAPTVVEKPATHSYDPADVALFANVLTTGVQGEPA